MSLRRRTNDYQPGDDATVTGSEQKHEEHTDQPGNDFSEEPASKGADAAEYAGNEAEARPPETDNKLSTDAWNHCPPRHCRTRARTAHQPSCLVQPTYIISSARQARPGNSSASTAARSASPLLCACARRQTRSSRPTSAATTSCPHAASCRMLPSTPTVT